MTPFYDEDGITIYLGNCRDILPLLQYDVVVTDPPYGIGDRWARESPISSRNGSSRLWGHGELWDDGPPPQDVIDNLVLTPEAIVWGGHYFAMPPRSWVAHLGQEPVV